MAENGQETAESLLQDIQKKITEAFEVKATQSSLHFLVSDAGLAISWLELAMEWVPSQKKKSLSLFQAIIKFKSSHKSNYTFISVFYSF